MPSENQVAEARAVKPQAVEARAVKPQSVVSPSERNKHYNITIIVGTREYQLSPIAFIDILDNRPVIEYSFKSIDSKTHKIISAERISYYFSNGGTNGLNSNFRFPMLYFATGKSKGETTMVEEFSKTHTIIKGGLMHNFNGYEIDHSIFYYLRKNFDRISKHFKEKHNISITEESKYRGQHGLISIFKRLSNFLSLIILLHDTKIINFTYPDLDEYLCNGNKVYLKYRPIEVKNDPISFDDIWRFLILKKLHELYQNLYQMNSIETITYKITSTEAYGFPLIRLRMQNYNNLLGLFSLKEPNTITPYFKNKIKDFLHISNNIFNSFSFLKSKLPPEEKTSLLENIRDTNTFLPDETENQLVNYLKKYWEIEEVREKYLKYKIKYYILKKLQK